MGKLPARAIEARRLKVTPELLANIRHRYEHTPESLSTMAADLGCCGETVRNIGKREGWVRYQPPPRDLSPAARLLARAERLAAEQGAAAASPSPERGKSTAEAERRQAGGGPSGAEATLSLSEGGNGEARAGGGEDKENAEPPQLAETAEQLHRELNGLLAVVTATREHMKREHYGKHDLREAAQVIANLTTALRTLQPLLCGVPPTGADSDYDDMPADLDAFREALARRIEAFMESRPDEGDAGEDGAGSAAAAQS